MAASVTTQKGTATHEGRNGRRMTDPELEQTQMNLRRTRRHRGDEGTHWRQVSIFGGVLEAKSAPPDARL
ncbi:hypothetical protein DPX16_0155 [Anabarilius grahami]|uniref:Uncharacterized protein n=1 Tax=Anabarilius grahami TaxID=495550 RepID=A0A3N0Z9L9_ANAGA|nr:hypothetical protein DPX16_0155 [Anabarilius grahami]